VRPFHGGCCHSWLLRGVLSNQVKEAYGLPSPQYRMLKLFVSRQYLVDGIHPGDEGHREIADAIRIGRDELSADFAASQLCVAADGCHGGGPGPSRPARPWRAVHR
jgi:hypothetical protein